MARIFISWSKERSLTFASALQGLMSQVLRVEPPAPDGSTASGSSLVALSLDLPKGGSWFQNLAGLLEHARAGIICVTPENCSSPWLLFEAGALIRCDVEVALFPVLLDLPASALEGPLSLVQATVIERNADAITRETHGLLKRLADHVNGRSLTSHDGTIVVDGPDDAPEAWHQFVTRIPIASRSCSNERPFASRSKIAPISVGWTAMPAPGSRATRCSVIRNASGQLSHPAPGSPTNV